MENAPDTSRLALLRWQLNIAWSLLEFYLDGLTDDECLWEPATPCWTVRQGPDGRWWADWEVPEPDPVPMTTIGWLTWHIGFWWSQAYDGTFGTRAGGTRNGTKSAVSDDMRISPEGVDWPGDITLTTQWLRDLHSSWVGALDTLTEADLDSFERSEWFLRGTRPLIHILAWVNAELMKNVAEIGVVRRQYALRDAQRA